MLLYSEFTVPPFSLEKATELSWGLICLPASKVNSHVQSLFMKQMVAMSLHSSRNDLYVAGCITFVSITCDCRSCSSPLWSKKIGGKLHQLTKGRWQEERSQPPPPTSRWRSTVYRSHCLELVPWTDMLAPKILSMMSTDSLLLAARNFLSGKIE